MINLESSLDDDARGFIRKEIIDRVPSYLRNRALREYTQTRGRPIEKNKIKPYEREFLDDFIRDITIECKIKYPELRGYLIRRLVNYYLFTPIEEDF